MGIMDPDCNNCYGEGWVCESHTHMAWLDGKGCCGEPAVPCSCNVDQELPPGFRVLCQNENVSPELKFMVRLRLDAMKQLNQARVVTRLLPPEVREVTMGQRISTLRDMIRQYGKAITSNVFLKR